MILIEQLHVDVYVPNDLGEAEAHKVTRTLSSKRFQSRLAASIRRVAESYKSLAKTTIRLSR